MILFSLIYLYLEHFNEDSYFSKLAQIISETPGLTADRLANNMKVNVVLMKEHLKVSIANCIESNVDCWRERVYMQGRVIGRNSLLW